MLGPLKANIDPQKLSILSASILLLNGFSRLIVIPSRGFRITIFSIQWAIEISGRSLFMLLLAALAIAGTESILRSHPYLEKISQDKGHYSTVIHWILPALSAFGGSAAVSLLPGGPRWWLGLLVVLILLVTSITGEFFVLDRTDRRHQTAALVLSVLGLTVEAIILAAIHASSTRSAMALPVVIMSSTIIALRLLDLYVPRSRKTYAYSLGIGLIIGELAFPLVFLPITSITFSIILVLATYTLAGLSQYALKENLRRGKILEYLFVDFIAMFLLLLLPSG